MKHFGKEGSSSNGCGPNGTAGSLGSVHKSGGLQDTTWNEFIAHSRTLLAKSPDVMTAAELDLLEAISDALIHLVGYASASGGTEGESDPAVSELQAWRRRHERARARSAGGGVLSSDERQT